jgi:hypothetical protein
MSLLLCYRSRDSVVGIATSYGLDDQQVGVQVLLGSLLHIIQTGCRVHTTSYTMDMGGGSFPWVKRPGPKADHSPPTSVEVEKMWIYTSTPPSA